MGKFKSMSGSHSGKIYQPNEIELAWITAYSGFYGAKVESNDYFADLKIEGEN